jgi:hypothetical protein
MAAGGGAEAMTGAAMCMAIVHAELPVAERRMGAAVDMRVAEAGAGDKPTIDSDRTKSN